MHTKKYTKGFGFKPELQTQEFIDDQTLGLGVKETYFIPLTIDQMEAEEKERLDHIQSLQNKDDLIAQLQEEITAIQQVCP